MSKILIEVKDAWKKKQGGIHLVTMDKRFKNMTGTVKSVPTLGSHIIRGIDVGLPPPRPHYSGDMEFGFQLQQKASMSTQRKTQFCPTTYEPEYIYESDIEVEVKLGDTVYFSPQNTHDGAMVAENIYAMQYSELICTPEKMLAGWVLIDMVYDEGVEDLDVGGKTVKGKATNSGIITEVNSKPTVDKGRIVKLPKPLKSDYIDFSVGDHVLFKKNRNWEVEIEGKKYYVIHYWDVIAVL